jgi:hypothetical protein
VVFSFLGQKPTHTICSVGKIFMTPCVLFVFMYNNEVIVVLCVRKHKEQ